MTISDVNGERQELILRTDNSIPTDTPSRKYVNINMEYLELYLVKDIVNISFAENTPKNYLTVNGEKVIKLNDEDNNILVGEKGRNAILGSSRDDIIIGGDVNDNISGLLGNDTIIGKKGNDSLFGEEGNDLLVGVKVTMGWLAARVTTFFMAAMAMMSYTVMLKLLATSQPR